MHIRSLQQDSLSSPPPGLFLLSVMKNPLTYLSRFGTQKGVYYNAHQNRKGCKHGPVKTRGYQRKCKIFFCWTRKIQYQCVHQSNFKQFSVRAARPGSSQRGLRRGGGRRHQILYNYRKGAIRVAGEKSGQKMNLMHWIFKIFYWKRPWVSTTPDGWGFLLFLNLFMIKAWN